MYSWQSHYVQSLWKLDRPWPDWAYRRFGVQINKNETVARTDQPAGASDSHPLFKDQLQKVYFERTDKRSAVVIVGEKIAIGELWLRLAIFPRSDRRWFFLFCETYFYRRGWRDELTAQMDEQAPGSFMMPSRSHDMICQINKDSQSILLFDGGFSAKLMP
ncbi:hypothetical protein [Pseudogemmobacter bohemicus]|uniref:hypothetical protein n=1 Tax=Pseudogemmobacter bohemicus TaxID=2250708 RepID=UPI001300464A|nr:hypothetical protein [Pseudogemmobacter bohemicus]